MANSRQRRIDHDPARDTLGILCGQRVTHHVADVVGDEIGLLDFQMVHYSRDVGRLVYLCVARVGMCRETHAAQVGNDHGVILRQHRGDRSPHIAGIAKAVKHDDGRPMATDAHIQRRAIRGDVRGVERSRKRCDARLGRQCKTQGCENESDNTRHGFPRMATRERTAIRTMTCFGAFGKVDKEFFDASRRYRQRGRDVRAAEPIHNCGCEAGVTPSFFSRAATQACTARPSPGKSDDAGNISSTH